MKSTHVADTVHREYAQGVEIKKRYDLENALGV